MPYGRLWQPFFGLLPGVKYYLPTYLQGEKPLVLVTHDESTFNANDGKRKMWMEDGKQPLRPKGKGKGIMVSGFLTPGGILTVHGYSG